MEALIVLIAIAVAFGIGWSLGHFKSLGASIEAAKPIISDIEKEVEFLKADAEEAVREVEARFAGASSVVKQFEAVAILKLKHAEAKAKDIALAVELAVRRLF